MTGDRLSPILTHRCAVRFRASPLSQRERAVFLGFFCPLSPGEGGPLAALLSAAAGRVRGFPVPEPMSSSTLYITANLYRPNQPAGTRVVLLQAGHTQEGKPEDQRIAANLALKGFVALALTPSVKVKESRRIAGSSKGRWQAGPSLSTSSWEPRRFSLARAQRGTLSGTLCDPWIILRAGPMWTPHVWAPQVALEAGP